MMEDCYRDRNGVPSLTETREKKAFRLTMFNCRVTHFETSKFLDPFSSVAVSAVDLQTEPHLRVKQSVDLTLRSVSLKLPSLEDLWANFRIGVKGKLR
ncbi:hypothetical protein N657DRAFT_497236 [Parathielavia appendiculata]|uniref:Uncharacterized protein n=1 Tax=Parathielavia appendiculata TaxID=2587402 RepID=A0AAN6TY59_9PEZI|nr:hypothetical protein N657DRAFT_497236 [Parathielavia appendiculata]